MTTLKNKLANDATVALKQQNSDKLAVLRYALGVIQTVEKKNKTGAELTDEQTSATLANIAKQARDNIALYTKVGETEKAEEARNELAILQEYLPQQLTTEEIVTIVQAAILEAGDNANIGTVMKIVVPQTKNKADGKTVKDVVTEHLNSK